MPMRARPAVNNENSLRSKESLINGNFIHKYSEMLEDGSKRRTKTITRARVLVPEYGAGRGAIVVSKFRKLGFEKEAYRSTFMNLAIRKPLLGLF